MVLLAAPASATAAPKSIDGFVGGTAGVNSGGLFTQLRDVAVYTGDDADSANDKIFVTEGLNNNSRVQRLDGDGNFELIWGRDTIANGAPGNVGEGFEICSTAVSGAANCKSAPSGSADGELDDPRGVAVNQATGDVYVMDRDNERVQQFTLDGGFIRAWGGEGAAAGQFGAIGTTTGIAVSPVAPHDVFVTDPGNRRVLQFEADGTFVRGWGHGVANGGDAFQVCEASCQAGNTTGSAARFANGWPRDLAVDADGVVYASDGSGGERIVRFDSDLSATPASALLAPLSSPDLLAAGTTVGLELDPATGNLLVGRDPASGAAIVQEIADPSAEIAGSPAPTIVDTHTYAEPSTIIGIGFSATNGNIYLGVSDLFAPTAGTFAFDGECALGPNQTRTCAGLMVLASGVAPTIDSVGSADIGTTTAEVTGSMNVGGGVGRYRFEVSADGVEWEPVGTGYLAGAGARVATATVSGLQPATMYRLRASLSKQDGYATFDLVLSDEVTFVTDPAPPDVATLGSSNRTETSARLRGRIDPNGSSSTYRFEIGPAGGPFDRQVPVPDGSAGAGNDSLVVVEDVDGLQPGTEYQYRLVGSNFVGDSPGDVVTFRTRASGGAPQGPARGYELVSPADKLSGVGLGYWETGPGKIGFVGEAAHAGERFAASATQGSVLTDGKFAWANDWALAERTPQGWVSAPIASRRAHGTQYKAFLLMSAAADDLSLMSWTSNAHSVAIFPEMEGWDEDQVFNVLLLRDWAGAWEVFGTTDPGQNQAEADGPTMVAGDGSVAVAQGNGLGGPTDPSNDASGQSVIVDDVSAGLSDTFPGAGIRLPANVCTDGTVVPAVADVGGDLKQAGQGCLAPAPGRYARLIGDLGATFSPRSGAVSRDGSRVFFTSGEGSACDGVGPATSCPAQLYVRQRNADGEIVVRWISRTAVTAADGAAEDQDASLMAPVSFEGASSNGDKALFSTAAPLTADDSNGQGAAPPAGGVTSGVPAARSWDLFMYDLAEGDDPAGGGLTRITAGPEGDGECNSGAGQTGSVRFVSDDGARVFFTCAAPLSGVGVPGSGTSTEPGGSVSSTDALNLYLYDAHESGDDRWRFVARLPRSSALGSCATTATGLGPEIAPLSPNGASVELTTGNNCVSGTPDGSFVTFWTDGRLTPDDPDALSGDIYGYDVANDSLSRVSAPQGGAGGTYQCAPGGVSAAQCYGDTGIGPPEPTSLEKLGVATGVDGVPIAIFESGSRLVADDTDDAHDVYQWRDGELSLVSTGTAGVEGAFYVGNDLSGRNVYVATRDRLTWQDSDAVLDVYSARVDGGIPQPPAPPVCSVLGGLCQGEGASPTSSTIDSDLPGSGDAAPLPRLTLAVRKPSAAALRKAARGGVLTVGVRVSGPATARVVARARIGGRTRQVAAGRRRAATAGVVRVRLPLSKPARRQLARARELHLRLVASAGEARPVTSSVVLKRRPR